MTSKQAFLNASTIFVLVVNWRVGLRTYVRTYVLARVYNYVQSIYLVGGGLIIEANIPVQELEGQRGEGAYFREDTVYWVKNLFFGARTIIGCSGKLCAGQIQVPIIGILRYVATCLKHEIHGSNMSLRVPWYILTVRPIDSFIGVYSVSGLVVSWVTYLATNNFVVTMNKIGGYAHAQAWSRAC